MCTHTFFNVYATWNSCSLLYLYHNKNTPQFLFLLNIFLRNPCVPNMKKTKQSAVQKDGWWIRTRVRQHYLKWRTWKILWFIQKYRDSDKKKTVMAHLIPWNVYYICFRSVLRKTLQWPRFLCFTFIPPYKVTATYLDSLLITRINAPFSSFNRRLSSFINSIFYKNKQHVKLSIILINLRTEISFPFWPVWNFIIQHYFLKTTNKIKKLYLLRKTAFLQIN